MTFDEILNKELTPTERDALKRMKSSSEWTILRDIVESHILHWTYNLLVDNLEPEEKLEDNLKSVRGFVKGWRALKRSIEQK